MLGRPKGTNRPVRKEYSGDIEHKKRGAAVAQFPSGALVCMGPHAVVVCAGCREILVMDGRERSDTTKSWHGLAATAELLKMRKWTFNGQSWRCGPCTPPDRERVR